MKVYTLGRGMLFFKPPGSSAFEDFGNVKEFALSINTEKLEHYSTSHGIKVKDAEIVKQQEFNVSFEIDELRVSTLEKFLLASRTTTSTSAGTVTDEAIDNVLKGFWYKLNNYNILPGSVTVTDDASPPNTFTEGTDYLIDYKAGAIYIVPEGSISDGTNLRIDYSYSASTKHTLQAGEQYTITGTLWFKGDPPKGAVMDVLGDISLTPEGELNLIGDDWLSVRFTGTFTEKPRVIVREIR